MTRWLMCCVGMTMLGCATAQEATTYKGYKLVWADEFSKDGKPDPKNWVFEKGFVRNKELQWYQPDNAFEPRLASVLTPPHDN